MVELKMQDMKTYLSFSIILSILKKKNCNQLIEY